MGNIGITSDVMLASWRSHAVLCTSLTCAVPGLSITSLSLLGSDSHFPSLLLSMEKVLCVSISISALGSSGFRCVVMGTDDSAVNLTLFEISDSLCPQKSFYEGGSSLTVDIMCPGQRNKGSSAPDCARKGFSLCMFCAFLFGFLLL